MKIIFSPSKKQKIVHIQTPRKTNILFREKTKHLVSYLQGKSIVDFQDLMKLSSTLASKTYSDYQNFNTIQGRALSTFSGTSFSALSLLDYTDEQWGFAQKHVLILSALYGVLRPCDMISTYRLNMHDRILKTEIPNLYHYWSDVVYQYFKNEDQIINLASAEYVNMLDARLSEIIINIHFLIEKAGTYKTIPVHAKKQRGAMLDVIITHNIINTNLLKKYKNDEFVYDPVKSDDHNMYFVKKMS